jgi:hypothetical protein
MRCRRCDGFMIVEPFADDLPTGLVSGREALGTRCVNCGNIEDVVIHANRLEPRPSKSLVRHYSGIELTSASSG